MPLSSICLRICYGRLHDSVLHLVGDVTSPCEDLARGSGHALAGLETSSIMQPRLGRVEHGYKVTSWDSNADSFSPALAGASDTAVISLL